MRLSKRAFTLALLALLAALGAVGWLSWGLSEPGGVRPPPLPGPSVARSGPASAPTSAPASTEVETKAVSASGAAVRTSASAPATPAPVAPWIRNPPDLGLTRVLSGEQNVLLGGKLHKVLGTKPSMSEASLGQPVLAVRDERSGQVEYFESGLQFRLAAGQSYPEFFKEHPHMQVLFHNTDFAKVKVDAGFIAETFRKLTDDSRVTFVGFLLPQVVAKPK